jgi:hypothetical protein
LNQQPTKAVPANQTTMQQVKITNIIRHTSSLEKLTDPDFCYAYFRYTYFEQF